jgi:hypothetical protein
VLVDKYKPDLVFTHWPIDFNMDHRAASLLTYEAWLRGGKKFALYYMEAELGTQTQTSTPRITWTLPPWRSARTRRGRPTPCGTMPSGLSTTGCGRSGAENTAVSWQRLSTTTPRVRQRRRYRDRQQEQRVGSRMA